jgi:hypothetical protein
MYDWNTVPDWVRYIATDQDGDVYGYEHKPTTTLRRACWVAPTGRIISIHSLKDWDESCEERSTIS